MITLLAWVLPYRCLAVSDSIVESPYCAGDDQGRIETKLGNSSESMITQNTFFHCALEAFRNFDNNITEVVFIPSSVLNIVIDQSFISAGSRLVRTYMGNTFY
jgi:hypothetical protein